MTSQNPHVERLLMTAFVLGLPETKVRVIAPDVGGGFGSKIYLYPEETAMVWASKRVNRPIKWTAERSESFLSDAHGRDHVTHAELALDKDGKFLAMRVHTIEHMLSAVYALGIDNLTIELNANEPPVADGSSRVFFDTLKETGLARQEAEGRMWYRLAPAAAADDPPDRYLAVTGEVSVDLGSVPLEALEALVRMSDQRPLPGGLPFLLLLNRDASL